MIKSAAKISSGMKLNGAGDGPSDHEISEKMRVMLRSLERNKANIENGNSLLQIAAEGVQNQVEIMKKAKEIALRATDGTYSESDVNALQEELRQLFDQSEDIAVTTNYNGVHLLCGDHYLRTKTFFETLDTPVVIEGSGLGIIPGHRQMFEPYITGNLEFDFSGKTKDDILALKGTSFYLRYDDNGDGTIDDREIKRKYIFLEDGAVAPTGFIGITLDDSWGKAQLIQNIAYGIYGNPVQRTRVEGEKVIVEAYENYDAERLSFGPGASVDATKLNGTDTYTSLNLQNGQTDQPPNVPYFDFASFDTDAAIEDLVGKGIRVGDYTLIFTDSGAAGGTYPPGCRAIDLAGYAGWTNKAEMLAQKVADAIGSGYSNGLSGFSASAPGAKVEIKTNLGGSQSFGAADPIPPKQDYGATGLFANGAHLSGGVDSRPPVDSDDTGQEGHVASITLNGLPAADTGFRITGYGQYDIMFVAGSAVNGSTIGVDALVNGFSRTIGNYVFSVSGGNLHIVCNQMGSGGNNTRLYDTVPGHDGMEGVAGLAGGLLGGEHAVFDTSITDADIADLAGSAFRFVDTSYRSSSYGDVTYEFYDSGSADPALRSQSIAGAYGIDLNGVGTLAALVDLLNNRDPDYSSDSYVCADPYGMGTSAIENRFTISGGHLQIVAKHAGIRGNDSKLYPITMQSTDEFNKVFNDGDNAHYTLDFGQWFEDNQDAIRQAGSVADYLNGKGFRANCSTCENEWINIEFVTDLANANPASYNYPVDVSGVRTAEDLVEAIYAQTQGRNQVDEHGNPVIGPDGNPVSVLDHFTQVRMEEETDPVTGDPLPHTKLTLFDKRLSSRGDRASVEDGVMSDSIPHDIDFYDQEIPIQTWTRSNQIVQLRIPRTTLDHLFGVPMNFLGLSDRTRAYRTLDGIDGAIDYLLLASTRIGVQQNRLDYTHDNVVAASENLTGAESGYRDADMAKEITEFTKSSVLSKTAQASLKYANQRDNWIVEFLGKK